MAFPGEEKDKGGGIDYIAIFFAGVTMVAMMVVAAAVTVKFHI